MTAADPTLKPTLDNPEHHLADANCDPESCETPCENASESVSWCLSSGVEILFIAGGDGFGVLLNLSDDAIANRMVNRSVTRAQVLVFAKHLLTLAGGRQAIGLTAANLRATVAHLDEHIHAKAEEIAAGRVADAEARAKAAEDELRYQANLSEQRFQDLQREHARSIEYTERCEPGRWRLVPRDSGLL